MRRKEVPYITIIIAVIYVIGFLYELCVGQNEAIMAGGMYQGAFKDGEYYRILSSAFLHNGIAHIAVNMLCLFAFGTRYETSWGHLRFLMIYTMSIIGSAALINVVGIDSIHVGASGAIWGIMMAAVVWAFRGYDDYRRAIQMIAFQLACTLVMPGISWQGHIGGGIAGLIFGLILLHKDMNTIKIEKRQRKVNKRYSQIDDRGILQYKTCSECGQKLSIQVKKCPVCGKILESE